MVAIDSGDRRLLWANGAAVLARINRFTKSVVGSADNFPSVGRQGVGSDLFADQLDSELAALGAGDSLLIYLSLHGVAHFCGAGDRSPR